MTERILDFDRSVVPQETGHWCGPSACQVALSVRKIAVPESVLAREIGTTINGTDYVGLIERILDVRVPDARYTSTYMPNDPPTAAQKNQLWRDVKKSIDAGYAVVMNWVAPPGNHPIPVRGEAKPAYRGTVFHYVTVVGYSEVNGVRQLLIADSGFSPFVFWVSFDQAATLVPPKGYAFADPTLTPTTAPVDPQADILMRAMGGQVPFGRYQQLLPGVLRCFREGDINTVKRRAMWIAQVGHESGGLRYQEEIADGSAYEGRADLGNVNRGDGKKFKGRDFVQVTGRSNYESLSRWAFNRKLVPSATYFVDNPSSLATDEYAFLGTTWYWTTQRPLNDASDKGDLELATRYINGGLNGIEDRRRRYNNALALGDELMKLDAGSDDKEQTVNYDEKVESTSIFAAPGEGALWTLRQLIQSIDARAHEDLIEKRARRGDPDAIRTIALVASGKGKYRDPATVNYAISLLADISGKTVDQISALVEKGAVS
jgi:predicted chitinase